MGLRYMINKTFKELMVGDFYSFFHCHEIDSLIENKITIKKVKPGGFQEYIDMEFHLNASDEIVKAKLVLDRIWIGNTQRLNLFANDITKSFVIEITPEKDKKATEDLAYLIYNLTGLEDEKITISPVPVSYVSLPFDLRKILDVYLGEYQEMSYTLSNSSFVFKNFKENGKKRFLIEWQLKEKQ